MIAVLNLARGRDWIPKIAFPILSGLYVGLMHGNILIGLACIAGFMLWSIPGWEFSAITGRDDPNKYPAWIREIGLALFPLDASAATNKKRGVLMMGLRGMYLYPMFVTLSFILGTHLLLIGLVSGLQGVLYWAVGLFGEHKYSVAVAEFLWGAIIGAMLTI